MKGVRPGKVLSASSLNWLAATARFILREGQAKLLAPPAELEQKRGAHPVPSRARVCWLKKQIVVLWPAKTE